MRAGGGGGVGDEDGVAIARNVILQHLPLSVQVVGAFEAIGSGALSAAEGLPVAVPNWSWVPVADFSILLMRKKLAGSCGSVPRVP